jgi:hypothetical protein
VAGSQVERAAADEGAHRDIEECIRDAAVTVPCEDEDTWNSKRYEVLSTVAVEAATPTSPSCDGCRYGVGDVYEGICGVLFSCRVRDSNLHGTLDVLRNEAYDHLSCGGRVEGGCCYCLEQGQRKGRLWIGKSRCGRSGAEREKLTGCSSIGSYKDSR